ncbi:hypothetical protein GJ496_008840 [Pomphorhynchus laevis]|nr:hypothetical protein GJ496_008840 [Pomphorhynchus laevis]
MLLLFSIKMPTDAATNTTLEECITFDPRFHYLNYVQLATLCNVMRSEITVESTSIGFPTLRFPLFEFILQLRRCLSEKSLDCESFKLNGGAASYVVSQDSTVDEDIDSAASGNHGIDGRRFFESTSPTPRQHHPPSTILNVNSAYQSGSNYVWSSNDERHYLPAITNESDFSDFNDFDIIISMNIDRWDDIKNCALETLRAFMPLSNDVPATYMLWEAYVTKHVCVLNENDRWSLITFCNHRGQNLELKFVQSIRRSYQFSIDSFRIHLDPFFNLMANNSDKKRKKNDDIRMSLSVSEKADKVDSKSDKVDDKDDKENMKSDISVKIGDNEPDGNSDKMFPSELKADHRDHIREGNKPIDSKLLENFVLNGVLAESAYGDFQQAFYHLKNRLIVVRQPEEIRGGGLLRYCHLLVKGFKPQDMIEMNLLERYMCTRFLIDFHRPELQLQTIRNYEKTHLHNAPDIIEKWYECLQSVMEYSNSMNLLRNDRYSFDFYRYPKASIRCQHGRLMTTAYNNSAYQLNIFNSSNAGDHIYPSYYIQSPQQHASSLNYQYPHYQHIDNRRQYSRRKYHSKGASDDKSTYYYNENSRSSSPAPPPRPYNPQAFNIINQNRRSKPGFCFFQGGPPFLIESRGSN